MFQTDARQGGAVTDVRPFQIRGRFLTAVSLQPAGGLPDAAFWDALDEKLRQTPHFFENAPLVLDMGKAPEIASNADFRAILRELRQRRLSAFGVFNATDEQVAAAEAAGLIRISLGRDAPLPSRDRRSPAGRDPKRLLPPDNLVIERPVRSGQTVMADRGDLIVIGPVSSGAELIAAGNIHVYGRLRGRAMAGVHGDQNARIFCHDLDAELLAIAGLYRTSDNIGDALRHCSVMVRLEGESLHVEPVGGTDTDTARSKR
ncbi:septum site-determining protein MinC [Pseudooceanicola sp. 502str34]